MERTRQGSFAGPFRLEGGAHASQAGHIDETDADPITAVDVGTPVRLSTSIDNESGYQLNETRAYSDIPSSGAGMDGTHDDPTRYAYDTMGRQIRTLAAHGTISRTISRTVYDGIGRRIESWTGTNDHLPAGEHRLASIHESLGRLPRGSVLAEPFLPRVLRVRGRCAAAEGSREATSLAGASLPLTLRRAD